MQAGCNRRNLQGVAEQQSDGGWSNGKPHLELVVGPLIPRFVEQNPQSEDSGLIMRSLGIIQQVLVASRGFLDRNGRPSSPADVARLATLSYGSVQGPHVWKLVDPQENEVQIRHEPTLIADDMVLVRMLPAVRSFIDFLGAHCVSEVPERQIKRHTGRGHRENVRFWTSREPLQRVVAGGQPGTDTRREVRVARGSEAERDQFAAEYAGCSTVRLPSNQSTRSAE